MASKKVREVKVKDLGYTRFSNKTRCGHCHRGLEYRGYEASFHCDNLPSELKYLFDTVDLFCNRDCITFRRIELERA